MYFERILDLGTALKSKSAFLLGPRSIGKTALYGRQLRPDRVYDLLDRRVFRQFSLNPSLIWEEIQRPGELVVIDEIQKLPDLLDEVHRAIEGKRARFLLTGSSARKLKRSHSNLLGGRAARLELLPFCSREIPDFDLIRFINHGGLPRHYLSSRQEIDHELNDYVSLYLQEEVAQEGLTRNLEGFSRLLEVMAIHSGDELAIEAFSSDCGVKASTFRGYLEVLKDTLMGFEVQPYLATRKRKAITRSKFFFFDVGVARCLAQRPWLTPKSELFGRSFEHFIAQELRAFLSYNRVHEPLCYWRSTSQMEVDFVVADKLALEVKAVSRVEPRHLRGLRALSEEKQGHSLVVVSLEDRARKVDGVEILPWSTFLKRLWGRDWL